MTPDHVPCRNGDGPISWDDWCWTHDNTGIADCSFLNAEGRVVGHQGATAQPIGEWS
jgi:hypothetical protein